MKYLLTDGAGIVQSYGEAGSRNIARQQVTGDQVLYEIDTNSGWIQCGTLRVLDGVLAPIEGEVSPIDGEGIEVTLIDL